MPNGETTYVIYDPKTGNVMGSHRSIDENGRAVAEPSKKIRTHLRRALELEPSQRADVLEVQLPPGRFSHEYFVDPEAKKLVEKYELRLEPERDVIDGDGEDRTPIAITVVDGRGRVVRSFEGEIMVVTSRGRLSERGGRLALRGGTGGIVLQSAPETVHRVEVGAYDPNGRCSVGTTEVEFL